MLNNSFTSTRCERGQQTSGKQARWRAVPATVLTVAMCRVCSQCLSSAFPVPLPFPVPFHGLCAPASDFAMWLTFLLKRDSLSFCFNKTYQKHIFAGRATRKCKRRWKRHWKRHWKGTGKGLGTDTAHGNSSWNSTRHHLKTAHACASVGLRSPSTPRIFGTV